MAPHLYSFSPFVPSEWNNSLLLLWCKLKRAKNTVKRSWSCKKGTAERPLPLAEEVIRATVLPMDWNLFNVSMWETLRSALMKRRQKGRPWSNRWGSPVPCRSSSLSLTFLDSFLLLCWMRGRGNRMRENDQRKGSKRRMRPKKPAPQ